MGKYWTKKSHRRATESIWVHTLMSKFIWSKCRTRGWCSRLKRTRVSCVNMNKMCFSSNLTCKHDFVLGRKSTSPMTHNWMNKTNFWGNKKIEIIPPMWSLDDDDTCRVGFFCYLVKYTRGLADMRLLPRSVKSETFIIRLLNLI